MEKKEKKPAGYWTKEKCYEEALKYKSRYEFSKNSKSAYEVARKKEWLTDYDWFENTSDILRKLGRKWTYETCYEEALKYKSRGEFYHKNQSAYQVAKRSKWLDDYTWFEKLCGKWDKETCYEEAKKYEYLKDFRKNSNGAFGAARKNGWISTYTWLEKERKPNGYWSMEMCHEEAKKYKSKREFEKGSLAAYSAARKNGWIDDYTWFEKRRVCDKPIYVVYCYKDDETNSVYVGLTNNMEKRHKEHCNGSTKHGKTKYDTVYKYFHSIGKEVPNPIILKKNLLAKDAQHFEQYYVDLYKNTGMNVLNIAKAGSLGGLGIWTREMCYEEAKKFKSRNEFWEKKNTVYNIARENKWLDDYIWFKPSATGKKWNKETCYEEAKKYKSRNEFRRGNSRAYNLSLKNGWIDDYTWFEELKKQHGYWTKEMCYEEAKKYKSKNEFSLGCSSAYSVSLKNGWIDDYTWFVRPAPHNKKWYKDACYNEAIKCNSRREFYLSNGTAYEVSRKNGWLDEFFPKAA